MFPDSEKHQSIILKGNPMNKTLVLLKPDAFERCLIGYIITHIETEFDVIQARIEYMNTYLISRHYKDHVNKDYYNALHEFMRSGPTLALEVYGADPVPEMLKMRDYLRITLGTKNPRNLIHASDLENAHYELALWFPPINRMVGHVNTSN